MSGAPRLIAGIGAVRFGIEQAVDGSDVLVATGIPSVPADGLHVELRLRLDAPAAGRSQVALAHGEDGSGWWIGVGADGRVRVGAVTAAGPLAVAAGDVCAIGEQVRVRASLPGRARAPLRIRVDGDRAEHTESVVVSEPIVPARGPLLWGGRAVGRDLRGSGFTGTIADVAISVGDAAPPLAAWEGELVRR